MLKVCRLWCLLVAQYSLDGCFRGRRACATSGCTLREPALNKISSRRYLGRSMTLNLVQVWRDQRSLAPMSTQLKRIIIARSTLITLTLLILILRVKSHGNVTEWSYELSSETLQNLLWRLAGQSRQPNTAIIARLLHKCHQMLLLQFSKCLPSRA